jgi:hypothetical protein
MTVRYIKHSMEHNIRHLCHGLDLVVQSPGPVPVIQLTPAFAHPSMKASVST